MTMKLIQRGLFRLCFSTIVLIKIKTRYIFKKAVLKYISFGFCGVSSDIQCNECLADYPAMSFVVELGDQLLCPGFI